MCMNRYTSRTIREKRIFQIVCNYNRRICMSHQCYYKISTKFFGQKTVTNNRSRICTIHSKNHSTESGPHFYTEQRSTFYHQFSEKENTDESTASRFCKRAIYQLPPVRVKVLSPIDVIMIVYTFFWPSLADWIVEKHLGDRVYQLRSGMHLEIVYLKSVRRSSSMYTSIFRIHFHKHRVNQH